MGLIVQKYGGTSVADIERIRNVARRVANACDAGNRMVVILSAMAGVTDKLIGLADSISESPDRREMDVLLATGEQTTVALLSMMLIEMGYPAQSLLGYQVEVRTDNAYGNARIADIGAERITKLLDEKNIVVVAGFQGADSQGNITTLGRGGSDTSAVAIASALRADVCEIYTDVDGVYTADPNICRCARKLSRITYDEMLEMSGLGAKVLQIRSVEFAKKYNVPVHVRSSFSGDEGTLLVDESESHENLIVSGVTCKKNEARITLKKVPDRPGIASAIFTPLGEAGIVVDMIIQNARADEKTDVTFTVAKGDYKTALQIQRKVAEKIGAAAVIGDENVAKVSITGIGMKNATGVAGKMFAVLAAENINIILITTSDIRVSCGIEEKYAELAVRILHTAFGLDT